MIDNRACDNGSVIHYSLVFAAAVLAAPQGPPPLDAWSCTSQGPGLIRPAKLCGR